LRTKRQNFFLSLLPTPQAVATTGAHILQDTFSLAFKPTTSTKCSTTYL